MSEVDTEKYSGAVLENRFRVVESLDKGGVGLVFRGVDEHRGMDVAIKFLIDKPGKKDENVMKRFKQEAVVLNMLDHDNVVHVFAFGWHPELGPYLILEFVKGRGIDSYIKESGPFPLAEAIMLLIQLCEGLHHAHEAGILHRDLKPSNLMVVEQDGIRSLKILDFGIAKHLEAEKSLVMTQQGHVFGSPLYMSPEQCQGQPIDERGDIYSVGCVAYEMLTGEPPLIADTWLGTVVKHVTQMPEPPRTMRSDIPEAIDALVMRCLQKSKDDRYRNVPELIEELKRVHSTL